MTAPLKPLKESQATLTAGPRIYDRRGQKVCYWHISLEATLRENGRRLLKAKRR
jgi:hypothetical protein